MTQNITSASAKQIAFIKSLIKTASSEITEKNDFSFIDSPKFTMKQASKVIFLLLKDKNGEFGHLSPMFFYRNINSGLLNVYAEVTGKSYTPWVN